MITQTLGAAIYGVEAKLISIEVTIVNGSNLCMVGLPDSAIRESQHRIASVIKHIGKEMPSRRVIVNLAPASLRKEGACYDLPIALSILHTSEQIVLRGLDENLIMGELALDGSLRPISGALSMAITARKAGCKGILLPEKSAKEAAIVEGINVYSFHHISEVIAHLNGSKTYSPLSKKQINSFSEVVQPSDLDFQDVKGQPFAKRAMEIAAAGGHNILMIGPPGAGKTMLAKRMPTILPTLTFAAALETTKIYSVAQKLHQSLIIHPPFCAPHHTISDVALVGGGVVPQPGAISLAHNGILFLDELPEFKRTVLEVLRQPLEEKKVTISRAKMTLQFPANFMLVASMNPCPCGYYGHPTRICLCQPTIRKKYLNKISGPLMDRIDLHLEVTPSSLDELSKLRKEEETSNQIKKRVKAAREIQANRYKGYEKIDTNALLTPKMKEKFLFLSPKSLQLLKKTKKHLALSARSYDRICKIARTIADLAATQEILPEHFLEAIQYRNLDRKRWTG